MNPYLVCIDFDRTLSNEALIDETMELACQAAGLDITVIRATKKAAEQRGESFSTLEYVQDRESPATVQDVKDAFATIARQDSPLYPDALPLLQSLRDHSIPHLILTQGLKEWQELKIIATQLHEYAYRIIDEKDKGKEIITWREAENVYRPPIAGVAPAKSVVLIDDKAKSFTSLPSGCRGFLIRRPGEAVLPSQRGEVSKQVEIITSLNQVLDKIAR